MSASGELLVYLCLLLHSEGKALTETSCTAAKLQGVFGHVVHACVSCC